MPNYDRCSCACYSNGIAVTLIAQLTVFLAFAMGAWALTDCKFVVADLFNSDRIPDFIEDIVNEKARRGFGFFFHEDANGECSWNSWGNFDEDIYEFLIEGYMDWLGNDWNLARGFGSAAVTLGVIVWIWSWFFACISHVKGLRMFAGGILILVGTSFMLTTLSLLGTDWCAARNCEFASGCGYAVGSGVLYLLAGIPFCIMKDHPGAPDDDELVIPPQQPYATTGVVEEAPQDDDENDPAFESATSKYSNYDEDVAVTASSTSKYGPGGEDEEIAVTGSSTGQFGLGESGSGQAPSTVNNVQIY